MSDYAHVPGGSLKFKGAGEKKKKKKSHSSSDRTRVDSEVRQSEKKDKGKGREERAGSGNDEVVVKNVAPGEGRKMTEAERRFEETQRLRREERAKKTANQSHKDRVAEYNAKLERLSEHHDMPKIGPG